MKKWVHIVGFALTALYLALYTLAPKWASGFSNGIHDTLIQLSAKPPHSPRIVLVDIDDYSLLTYGQWPWPRHRLATMVNRIQADGASVVALDIIFPEPDRLSPTSLKAEYQKTFGYAPNIDPIPEGWKDYDKLLAASLTQGTTILGCYMRNHKNPKDRDPNYRGYYFLKGPRSGLNFLHKSNDLISSIPELSRSASNTAFFNTVPDQDGIIRRTPLIWSLGDDRLYPSVGLEAVRMFLKLPQAAVILDHQGAEGIKMGDRFIPTDRHGQLVVNYREIESKDSSTQGSFPHYPAHNILTGNFTKGTFQDSIVIIGTTAVGLRDLRYTPLSQSFAGAEVHANVIDNILAGDSLKDPIWMEAFEWISILLIGFLITWIVASGRSWLAFLLVLLTLTVCIALGLYFFHTQNLLFIPSHLILTALLLYLVLTVFSYWNREQRERRLRKTFGPMVSDKVMRYLEEQKQGQTDLSQNVDASILFIDVQDFTKIAEQLGPEKTSAFIKRFLSTVSTITMQYEGFVDKYIGDMMMAVWGVPYPLENHAEAACQAALDQLKTLDEMAKELTEQFGHSIKVRIGINSGKVTAGNMGSAERFNYTVIGDAVNIAARLEPLNKVYRTRTIIGKETASRVGELFATRLLDRTVLDGRATQVEIYELLGMKKEIPESTLRCVAHYEEGLKHSWANNTELAIQSLHLALEAQPHDGPSQRLQATLLAR